MSKNSVNQSKKGFLTTPLWYEKSGVRYPRGTAVVKHVLHAPELEAWRLAVGFDASESIKNIASKRGTDLHALFAKFAKKEQYRATDEQAKYLKYFHELLQDFQVELHGSEKTLFSEEHTFGTTLDAIATVRSFSQRPLSLEYKTGKRFYPSHRYQAAVQRELLLENGFDVVDGAVIALINPKGYEVLYLDAEKCDMYFMRFLSFLEHFNEFVMKKK